MLPKFLKDISETISRALRVLAIVTPIYKDKAKLELDNYRPVSVLPILSKVLEKLM